MSLRHGILGFLSESEMTGYELDKKFAAIDGFWHATTSQIYRELNFLEKEGLAESRIEYQEGKPNKRLYGLTAEGLREFRLWIREEDEQYFSLKSPFLMKIYFSAEDGERTEKRVRDFILSVKEKLKALAAGGEGNFAAAFEKSFLLTCLMWADETLTALSSGK